MDNHTLLIKEQLGNSLQKKLLGILAMNLLKLQTFRMDGFIMEMKNSLGSISKIISLPSSEGFYLTL